jgi:hypothetical protein
MLGNMILYSSREFSDTSLCHVLDERKIMSSKNKERMIWRIPLPCTVEKGIGVCRKSLEFGCTYEIQASNYHETCIIDKIRMILNTFIKRTDLPSQHL